jgi:hypothetical protein
LHRLYRQDRQPIRWAMLQCGGIQRRQHEAWAAGVEMDVHTVLTRIAYVTAVSVVVVMVSGITVIVMTVVVLVRMVMVTMMIMAVLIIPVAVHKGSREGAHWRGKSHTQRGRKRKQPDHCPDQGNAPSAGSLYPRQHDLTSFCYPLTLGVAALLRRYPLYPFRMCYHNLT